MQKILHYFFPKIFLILCSFTTIKELNMKKTLLFLSLFAIQLFAQNKLSFEFDYAKFNYDSTSTYLEVYYSLNQKSLTLFSEGSKSFIGAYLTVIISDTNSKEILLNRTYQSKTQITKDDESYKSQNLLGNFGFILKQGTYAFQITGTDIADSNKFLTYNEVITVKDYPADKFSISDIQLASRIVSDSKNSNSIFYKNTMEVFPNPHNIYSEQMPVLFFYSELYNLNLPQYSDKNLLLVQQLNDSYGNQLEIKRKSIPTNNKSVVEAGVLNLKKYPSGSYTLVLSIFEDSTGFGISSSKRFYLINPTVVAKTNISSESMTVQSSEFGILSEEECDDLFDVSEPLYVANDRNDYEKLQTEESKREFLFNFWKRRDQIPETAKNEFKEEYLQRVRFVDERYRTFVKRGAKTDRGRVHLQYGEPDEIENYPSEYNMKPYEIWNYYSIEGGVVFIFGDVTGYNNYELLHSTKRGELRDDTWQRRITVD